MSGSINSSGSVERFTLAAGESKEFEVQKPGGCGWVIDVHGDESQSMVGVLNAVGTTVKLQSAEGAAAYADVGTVTVVPGGTQALTGQTGQFAKIVNTGQGLAHVVAKPTFRVQPKVLL